MTDTAQYTIFKGGNDTGLDSNWCHSPRRALLPGGYVRAGGSTGLEGSITSRATENNRHLCPHSSGAGSLKRGRQQGRALSETRVDSFLASSWCFGWLLMLGAPWLMAASLQSRPLLSPGSTSATSPCVSVCLHVVFPFLIRTPDTPY